MNKFYFLNDTNRILSIHKASHLIGGTLDPGESIWVTIPVNTFPFIKVWEDSVLLTYTIDFSNNGK